MRHLNQKHRYNSELEDYAEDFREFLAKVVVFLGRLLYTMVYTHVGRFFTAMISLFLFVPLYQLVGFWHIVGAVGLILVGLYLAIMVCVLFYYAGRNTIIDIKDWIARRKRNKLKNK